jgi:hypothetical protein
MKWLSAGLTFVNFSTVCGLIFGMIRGGLNPTTALFALTIGAVTAVAAYLTTSESTTEPTSGSTPTKRYRWLWTWAMGAIFAMFAVRSFCWLLYIDGDQWRIQSPNNLGDLALHITYIRNFANGVALWPENPIYVFSHLRYPAGVDLFNALLCLLHVDLARVLVWTGLLASAATFYAFYRWGGAFAVAGFLFNGGVMGFQFLNNFTFQDYQADKIAWKSIPLSMFVTQRGLLYAIPAGLILLWHWREKFFRNAAVAGGDDAGPDKDRPQRGQLQPLPFWIELALYASMPLFHVHTFLALTIVLVFLFAFESLQESKFIVDLIRKEGFGGIASSISPKRWGDLLGNTAIRKHIAILLGSALVPATFFVWLITDHFHAGSVLAWYPGWLLNPKSNSDLKMPFFQFWWMNFGILIPLVMLLLGVSVWRAWQNGVRLGNKPPEDLAFLLPATAIFLFGLFVKTAPWEWDNLKIMMWAYFLVLPFLWTRLIVHWDLPIRVAICIALFGSGFVSLLGGLAAPGFGFANRAELDGVGAALRNLPVEARFAAFPTYNHPLLLQGRKLVLGYPGHLWTQGFDYQAVENKLRSLMAGAGDWRQTARGLGARYIFWGREEKLNYPVSQRPWETTMTPVVSGPWGAIYDLDQAQPAGPNR